MSLFPNAIFPKVQRIDQLIIFLCIIHGRAAENIYAVVNYTIPN